MEVMPMRVFISYSTEDIELVKEVAVQISCHAQVDFWDESKVLGAPAWGSVYGWIDQSDLVIAIITDNTVRRAMAVGNEIGYAIKANKTIIPLITQNVPDLALGCLGGISYARITDDNFGKVIQAVEKVVIKKKEENRNATLFVVGGILAAIILGRSDSDDE